MNKRIEEKAFKWAKKNRKKIVKDILFKYNKSNFKDSQIIFLSWSPWAGKTEFINWMLKNWFDQYFLHIDLDFLRSIIPWYLWKEADSFQKWAIKIIEKLIDESFKIGLNMILDWTFWSKKATSRNIERAKNKWYNIKIYYINFNPIIAWKYTLWRELEEKRMVPLFSFYKQYFNSFNNIKFIMTNNENIELTVYKKILNKYWHSVKMYIINSKKDFIKYENEIKPKWKFIFVKLLFLSIKYRFFIKKGLIKEKWKQ